MYLRFWHVSTVLFAELIQLVKAFAELGAPERRYLLRPELFASLIDFFSGDTVVTAVNGATSVQNMVGHCLVTFVTLP